MERVMSVEEKIRRATEIYERRKQGETRPIAKVKVNNKKDIKLLKKMLIQLLICTSIYLIVYTIQNNQYIFSKDFITKVNEILSYDTNFPKIYEDIKNYILALFNKNQENTTNTQAIGGAQESTNQEQNVENTTKQENSQENQTNENQTSKVNNLSRRRARHNKHKKYNNIYKTSSRNN